MELDISNTQPSVVRWTNLPNNTYKVNWDIALDSNCKRMGIGVVIRDEQWELWWLLNFVGILG
jgi:hypothetical protein